MVTIQKIYTYATIILKARVVTLSSLINGNVEIMHKTLPTPLKTCMTCSFHTPPQMCLPAGFSCVSPSVGHDFNLRGGRKIKIENIIYMSVSMNLCCLHNLESPSPDPNTHTLLFVRIELLIVGFIRIELTE